MRSSMKDYGLKPLQKKIIEIALYIDNLCKENDITYYLMGGSALGAVRHNGFIPWDDDFDIFMTYDNYVKFIEVCKNKIDTEKYYLQLGSSKEWPLHYTKIRMNGTTYIQPQYKKLPMHQGIFVDVFCLNYVSTNKIIALYQFLCARLLTAKALASMNYKTGSLLKRMVMTIMSLVPNIIVNKILMKQVTFLNNKKSPLIGHFFGKAPFKKAIFPVSYLGVPKYIIFENTKLPVPEMVHEYLTVRFGNYMKLPSETEIKAVIHAEKFDLNIDYKDYLNQQSLNVLSDK